MKIVSRETLKEFFSKKSEKRASKNSISFQVMPDGMASFYTQSGDFLYKSDIIQQSIRCIATEISKVSPRHVIEKAGDFSVQSSPLQYVLTHPNSEMTLSDFLQKVVWTLFLSSNAFILPVWDESGELRGLYPLPRGTYSVKKGSDGRLFLTFLDGNGKSWHWPYDEIIHLRLDFSLSEWLGGDASGHPNFNSLSRLIGLDQGILKGVERGVNGSGITGVISYNSKISRDTAELDIKSIERLLDRSSSGIIPMDAGASFTQLSRNQMAVSADTIKFVDEKILRYFGVSQAILSGDFTREQYEAFYQKVLEPLVVSFGQAFTKVLLTKREVQGYGHKIIFFVDELIFMTTSQKLEMVRLLGDRGAIYENEARKILGLQPLPELEGVRMHSLNYANTSAKATDETSNPSSSTSKE